MNGTKGCTGLRAVLAAAAVFAFLFAVAATAVRRPAESSTSCDAVPETAGSGVETERFWRYTGQTEPESVRAFIAKRSRELPPEVVSLLAAVIVEECRLRDIDPALVLAVIETESSFRNWVRSPKDARGLMQILPGTGEEMARKIHLRWDGAATLYLPAVNVKVGISYLDLLLERFDSLEYALAAWNRGPNAVSRILGGGNLPSERFSRRVMARYRDIRPIVSSNAS